MKPISWKSYYDKFYDWEESTQKNYSNRLSDFGPAEFDDEETILPTVRSPGLLTTLLAAFTFSGSGRKRDSGRCDGDCAHCPPHYGYRYGRWYYGHGHDWGCELRGNGGCSGKCTRDQRFGGIII